MPLSLAFQWAKEPNFAVVIRLWKIQLKFPKKFASTDLEYCSQQVVCTQNWQKQGQLKRTRGHFTVFPVWVRLSQGFSFRFWSVITIIRGSWILDQVRRHRHRQGHSHRQQDNNHHHWVDQLQLWKFKNSWAELSRRQQHSSTAAEQPQWQTQEQICINAAGFLEQLRGSLFCHLRYVTMFSF